MLSLSHKNLEVYKISLFIVKELYRHTKNFSKEEQFNLVSQLRRAAVSISSNIAEGTARISLKEKKRFYEIARSSSVEVDTQIEISVLLNYLKLNDISDLEKALESVFKMLSKMISNLTDKAHSPNPINH